MLRQIILRSGVRYGPASMRFSQRSGNLDREKSKRKFSPLMRTSAIMQDGRRIYEVRLIVQRSGDIGDVLFANEEPSLTSSLSTKETGEKSKVPPTKEIRIETDEGTAILFSDDTDIIDDSSNDKTTGSGNCKKFRPRVSPFIEKMITDEINCRVALEALKEIMKFEDEDCSSGRRRSKGRPAREDQASSRNLIGRERVLDQLVDMIAGSRDNDLIIEGLFSLSKDRLSSPKNVHRDRLCDEALIRATNGKLDLDSLIDLVKILRSFEDPTYLEVLDALWIGIKARETDINENNLTPLFRLLPFFRENRITVRHILENKLAVHWWKLSGTRLSEILEVLRTEGNPQWALKFARKWSRLHINTAQERELFDFMRTLTKFKYVNEESLESSLAKYMRAKGPDTKDPALIALVMNYCGKNRIRNGLIFETAANYLIENAMDIPASLLAPIFVPFGYLYHHRNFQKSDDNFLESFRVSLDSRFSDLSTNDALNIVLSLIYLRQTPHDLVDRLFTTSFIEKMHTNCDTSKIMYLREKLCFLDRAMALESDRYSCRMVPEVHCEKRIFMRSRIKRITDLVYGYLMEIVGGPDKLSKSVMLGQLSTIDLYTLDILIHPCSMRTSMFSLTDYSGGTDKTAILINLPEHYCRNTSSLIGPQEMRIRHLKKLGFRVVTFNYTTLLRLRHCPKEMNRYLTNGLRSLHS